MENSRLIAPVMEAHSAGDFYALVSGERLDRHGAPARAAWQIEDLAASQGWPVGASLGSEAWLRDQLGVSRETLREAIRILEGRGAMQMRRGRSGGLVLLRPPIDRMAASLAAYLRAAGFRSDEFAQSVRGLDQLLAWELARKLGPLPPRQPGEGLRQWLARASGRQTYLICASALARLAPARSGHQGTPAALHDALSRHDATEIFGILAALPFVPSSDCARDSEPDTQARAGAIAMHMIERAKENSANELGNEASLCDDFATSRSLVRQALRILQDLDLVHVRLGRGGGYALKQPSPIGIIRQLFAWLAARNCDPFSLNALMWDLNAANVRLAGERLAAMPVAQRRAHCDRIDRLIVACEGPARFICLQQSLAEIAGCPMVDTLARCIVSYQARSYGDFPEMMPSSVLQAMEHAVVASLRSADLDLAERTLRVLQDETEELAIQSFGLRAAAE